MSDLLAGIMTGSELMAMTFDPLVAGDLVASGECHPLCLLASGDSETCDCACYGHFHGALTDAEVRDNDELTPPTPPTQPITEPMEGEL